MKDFIEKIKMKLHVLFRRKSAEEMVEQWYKERRILETDYQIDAERRNLRLKYKGEVMKAATSKVLIAFLFISCSAIEIFTGFVTIKSFELAEQLSCSPDFTPLITLIGAVVSEVIGFAVYAIKSIKENTQGGIVYDTAIVNLQNTPQPSPESTPAPQPEPAPAPTPDPPKEEEKIPVEITDVATGYKVVKYL